MFGTGVSPGFAELLAIVSATICDRVDKITVNEAADTTFYDSPATEIPVGFGKPIDDPELQAMTAHGTAVFGEAVRLVADALGVELDDVRCEAEYAQTTADLDLGSWTIAAGCVAGVAASWKGFVGDKVLVELNVRWRKGQTLEPDWKIEQDGWVIQIDGRPTVTLNVGFLPPPDFEAETIADFMVLGHIMTAAPPLNAIPAVVAAAPGIATYNDLALVLPRGTASLDVTTVDRKSSALPVPFAMDPAFPDRVPQGALLRPRLLPNGSRAAVAARLADGVPARGDPAAARLRRVRVPRSVGDRAAHRRHGRARVPERLPPPRREGRRGRGTCAHGFTCPFHGWCYGVDGTNTAVPRRKAFAEHNLQPGDIDLVPVRCETWGGCAWINFDDDAPPVRRVHGAGRDHPRRLGRGVAADREVVRGPPSGELEARDRGVRREVPRGGDASRRWTSPGCGTRCGPARRSTRGRSSKRRSTTCAC